jgi:hypothetical protein
VGACKPHIYNGTASLARVSASSEPSRLPGQSE